MHEVSREAAVSSSVASEMPFDPDKFHRSSSSLNLGRLDSGIDLALLHRDPVQADLKGRVWHMKIVKLRLRPEDGQEVRSLRS